MTRRSPRRDSLGRSPAPETVAGFSDPKKLRRLLTGWYDQKRRSLPWRETRDPYAIWISEVMLQQTRVETVIPYFTRFLERFPDADALGRAPLDDVLKVWENLGYYTRARNLHKAARQIVARFGGQVPDRREDLLGLPGIGRYTAGAILSIAYGQDLPAVDGNVRRVISRLFAIAEPIDDGDAQARIEARVAPFVPKRNPGRFNQALMELGAVCCTPKKPACPACPLVQGCLARLGGLVHCLPVRSGRKAVPHREAVAAVIRDESGRTLIVRRPDDGLLGSLWKFPGGILAPPETAEAGLARLVREELDAGIVVGAALARVRHAYTHFRVTLTAFRCSLTGSVPDRSRSRWARTAQLEELPFSKADRMIARLAIPDPED